MSDDDFDFTLLTEEDPGVAHKRKDARLGFYARKKLRAELGVSAPRVEGEAAPQWHRRGRRPEGTAGEAGRVGARGGGTAVAGGPPKATMGIFQARFDPTKRVTEAAGEGHASPRTSIQGVPLEEDPLFRGRHARRSPKKKGHSRTTDGHPGALAEPTPAPGVRMTAEEAELLEEQASSGEDVMEIRADAPGSSADEAEPVPQVRVARGDNDMAGVRSAKRERADAARAHSGAPRSAAFGVWPSDLRGFVTGEAAVDVAVDKKHAEDYFASGKGEAVNFGALGLCERMVAHVQGDRAEGLQLEDRAAERRSVGMGLAQPTRVQAGAVPPGVAGRDVLVKAQTGSGKTLAYLLPVVHRLLMHEDGSARRLQRTLGTLVLVLAPTRELCQQIEAVARDLLRPFPWIVPGLLIGGENRAKEKARLRKGVSVLIATPGRLLDHLNKTESFRCGSVEALVLDEADRMLDLGFEPRVKEIVDLLDRRREEQEQEATGAAAAAKSEESDDGDGPGSGGGEGVAVRRRRQVLLLSATLNERVQRLADANLENPVRVVISHRGNLVLQQDKENNKSAKRNAAVAPSHAVVDEDDDQMHTLPQSLRQFSLECPTKLRLVALLAFLRWKRLENPQSRVVVFMSSCDSVDFCHALLSQLREDDRIETGPYLVPPPVYRLHGNMEQQERVDSFKRFCGTVKGRRSRQQKPRPEASSDEDGSDGDSDDGLRESGGTSGGILVCTDVAARGLHFPAIDWIVQYDPPGEVSDYVHRVGRAARMGAAGNAVLFLQPGGEMQYLDHLKEAGAQLEPLALQTVLAAVAAQDEMGAPKQQQPQQQQRAKHRSRDGLSWRAFDAETAASRVQFIVNAKVSSDPTGLAQLAADGFRSYVRAYAVHPKALRPVFQVRSLHLGHVAKSFGLNQTPSMIAQSSKNRQVVKKNRERRQLQRGLRADN